MKPSVYPCEACGCEVAQDATRGRLKRFCSRECRGRGRYWPEPKRTQCTTCGVKLERFGALLCVECKQAARPAPREPRRNPAGHRISCACSAACRAYRVNLTREWRLKNPDGKRAQDARYRARYREEINEKSAARARTEERREWVRQWMDENREKVREQGRAQYRRNPERHRESTRAWREANADYYREVQRWHREERARVITPRAINSRTPWTEAELRIALDPSLTLAEAALMLGRTVSAVGGKRHKVRMSAS